MKPWAAVLGLTALVASAEPVPPGHERIPVIATNDDGKPTLQTIVIDILPEPYITHVCIREYAAPAIRCYILDTENKTWIVFDLTVKP